MDTIVGAIIVVSLTITTAGGLFYVYVDQVEENSKIASLLIHDLNVIKRGDIVTVHLTLENIGPGTIDHIVINELSMGRFIMSQNSANDDGIGDSFGEITISLPAGSNVVIPTDSGSDWDAGTNKFVPRSIAAGTEIPAGHTGAKIDLRPGGNTYPINWPDGTVDSNHEKTMTFAGEKFLGPKNKMQFWLDIHNGNIAGHSGQKWLDGVNVGDSVTIQFAYITNNLLRITDFVSTSIDD